MVVLPEQWRVHEGRDPEVEVVRLKRRFRAVSRRYERAMALRRFVRRARTVAVVGAGAVVIGFVLMQFSPWPMTDTFRHIVSFPNCNAARAVGLAPAGRGYPGYWSRHDRDRDGIACELWLR